MLNLKKTAVAVLAFGSSAAFAGTMGPVCAPGNVTVPCENPGWGIGAQALYLQPSFNDTAGNYVGVNTPANNQNTLLDVAPDWSWGFKLEGLYRFNTGNDLNVNWYHLGGKTTTRVFGADANLFDLGEEDPGDASNTYSVAPQWDAVNIEFGQHVDFGQMKNIRFHGGVQFARLKTDSTVLGLNADDTSYTETATAKYNGFGPRVGADMSYDFGNGLGIYANTAAAVLTGTSKVNVGLSGDDVYIDNGATLAGSTTAIVPEVEAKLGAMYTYAMPQGDLTLDVGYMWVNYFNAQTSAVGSSSFDSDFGLQGPYIGLKWVGSVV